MKKLTRSIILLIGLLAAWQILIILSDLPNYLLPPPAQVGNVFLNQFNMILTQTMPTLLETGLGFILGILCGCTAAFMLTLFKPLSRWLLPLIIISQAIPTFAIAPLLVLWLGYGLASKVAAAVLMVFFPIASACYDGLRNTPHDWLNLAKTMNATTWQLFYRIRLPAALPSLASGIRIAAVTAPIGAIVGEWVGASRGLGYLMLTANARMQIDLMFAALIMIVLMSLLLYFFVDKTLHRLIWWQ